MTRGFTRGFVSISDHHLVTSKTWGNLGNWSKKGKWGNWGNWGNCHVMLSCCHAVITLCHYVIMPLWHYDIIPLSIYFNTELLLTAFAEFFISFKQGAIISCGLGLTSVKQLVPWYLYEYQPWGGTSYTPGAVNCFAEWTYLKCSSMNFFSSEVH